MLQDRQIIAYTVDEPFDVTLRMLRRALACEGLRVPCELDTMARVRQELGVGVRRNLVLYVDDPIRLLEATVMNPAGALFIPRAVVLSNLDDRTCRVSTASIEPVLSGDMLLSVRLAVTNLHERILWALQRIGQKHTAASEALGYAPATA